MRLRKSNHYGDALVNEDTNYFIGKHKTHCYWYRDIKWRLVKKEFFYQNKNLANKYHL